MDMIRLYHQLGIQINITCMQLYVTYLCTIFFFADSTICTGDLCGEV